MKIRVCGVEIECEPAELPLVLRECVQVNADQAEAAKEVHQVRAVRKMSAQQRQQAVHAERMLDSLRQQIQIALRAGDTLQLPTAEAWDAQYQHAGRRPIWHTTGHNLLRLARETLRARALMAVTGPLDINAPNDAEATAPATPEPSTDSGGTDQESAYRDPPAQGFAVREELLTALTRRNAWMSVDVLCEAIHYAPEHRKVVRQGLTVLLRKGMLVRQKPAAGASYQYRLHGPD